MDPRKKKPKYKVYVRLRDAQNFARKLGVGEVDYAGRIGIANNCNYGMFLAHERGIPMPSAVIVQEQFTPDDNEDPGELAYYIPLGGAPGEIHIHAGHPAWGDIETAMGDAREGNQFSTGDRHHVILHELGELAMHQSVGADRFDPMTAQYTADEAEFRALGEPAEADEQASPLDLLADAVSDRAVENHSEFVAEVFAALMLGRDDLRDDAVVMEAYERFGGEQIVAWTEPPAEA